MHTIKRFIQEIIRKLVSTFSVTGENKLYILWDNFYKIELVNSSTTEINKKKYYVKKSPLLWFMKIWLTNNIYQITIIEML